MDIFAQLNVKSSIGGASKPSGFSAFNVNPYQSQGLGEFDSVIKGPPTAADPFAEMFPTDKKKDDPKTPEQTQPPKA